MVISFYSKKAKQKLLNTRRDRTTVGQIVALCRLLEAAQGQEPDSYHEVYRFHKRVRQSAQTKDDHHSSMPLTECQKS